MHCKSCLASLLVMCTDMTIVSTFNCDVNCEFLNALNLCVQYMMFKTDVNKALCLEYLSNGLAFITFQLL